VRTIALETPHMLLNTLALLLVAASGQTQAPAAKPAAAPTPASSVMSVVVEPSSTAGAAGQQWAQELRTALEARKDEFRAPRKGEKPELVVRIESVAAVADGRHMLGAALVIGARVSPFNVTYAGESRQQAEALARNLRRVAEKAKTAPPPPPPATKK
jgi:hypothetical protein